MAELFEYDPTDNEPEESEVLCEILGQLVTILNKVRASTALSNRVPQEKALLLADLEVLGAYVVERFALLS